MTIIDSINDLFAHASDFLGELLVVGAVFFLIEKIRPAEKSIGFFKPEFWQEIGLALLNTLLFIPVFAIGITFGVQHIIQPLIPHQMFATDIEALPILMQALLGAFILDFSTYWRHRFTHKYLWPVHSIHHSAEHLSWITSMRLHPLDVLTALIFDMTILHIVGFGGPGIVFSILFLKGFNYFTHANIEVKFSKPTRYIFASPVFHRWHHATEKEAHDKNFCAMFSCIDLVFGTYYHPEHLPESYSLGEDQKDYPHTLGGQLLYPFKKFLGKKKTASEE